MAPSSHVLGIDLGTTNSLCAVFEDGAPRLVRNAHGADLTPSVVGVLDGGEVVVGEAAREWMSTRPERTVACFKRWMGEDRVVELGERRFTAPELSALVLRSLKADAEADLGVEVTDAVITVPAYFNEVQRRATKRAGELAGLRVLRVIHEPTAAALAYGFHDARESRTLLVFDLGGGTFDVTVMEVFEGTLEILSSAGESRLGGEDFTDAVVAWVLRAEGRHLEEAEMRSPALVARLRAEVEAAKRALSTEPVARVRVPDERGWFADDARVHELDRAAFADVVGDLRERLAAPAARALRDARHGWGDVDEVLLVGGATNMSIVHEMIEARHGRAPRRDLDPDRAVALGAAVQAALIEGDEAVEDLVLTDVCPFTLGVEVVKEFGARRAEGYFSPVIHRNTTIPVSREEFYQTLDDGQTEILLRIYQGEARRTADNLKLGELRVAGIPAGPAGREIAVRFTYDLNGLLEVEALVPGTDQRFRTVLRQEQSGLSDAEVERARERMRDVKFYPRDDLENQRLLRRAENVLREVATVSRARLEEAVDGYERAMYVGDRDAFEAARLDLLTCLAALGFPYDPVEDPADE